MRTGWHGYQCNEPKNQAKTYRISHAPRIGFEKSTLKARSPTAHRAGDVMVEVRGFEPLASSVRGKRSAGLSYTPGRSTNSRKTVLRVETGRKGGRQLIKTAVG